MNSYSDIKKYKTLRSYVCTFIFNGIPFSGTFGTEEHALKLTAILGQ